MASNARIVQEYGSWHKNPIGLSPEVARAAGERLDALCASEYVLFHQLKKHHWMVVGAEYLPVHRFLDELADAAKDAGDRLAERVTALGGVPTGSPKGQQEQAVFAYEETEDAVDVRTMLGRDLSAYQAILAQMRRDLAKAREDADAGTEELLLDFILSHEDAAHHIDHWLEPDSLTLGIPRPRA